MSRSAQLSSAVVFVILAGCIQDLAQAATISIPWQYFNAPLANINAKCGDTLAFVVSGGPHSVTQVSSKSCSASLVKQWAAAPAVGTIDVPLTAAGSTYYLCDVGSHCSQFFMLVAVNASGPCGGASPSPSPAAKSPSPSPKGASPPPAKLPSPAPSPKPSPAPLPRPMAMSPKKSPPKKKPAPCHMKAPPPCKHTKGRK